MFRYFNDYYSESDDIVSVKREIVAKINAAIRNYLSKSSDVQYDIEMGPNDYLEVSITGSDENDVWIVANEVWYDGAGQEDLSIDDEIQSLIEEVDEDAYYLGESTNKKAVRESERKLANNIGLISFYIVKDKADRVSNSPICFCYIDDDIYYDFTLAEFDKNEDEIIKNIIGYAFINSNHSFDELASTVVKFAKLGKEGIASIIRK